MQVTGKLKTLQSYKALSGHCFQGFEIGESESPTLVADMLYVLCFCMRVLVQSKQLAQNCIVKVQNKFGSWFGRQNHQTCSIGRTQSAVLGQLTMQDFNLTMSPSWEAESSAMCMIVHQCIALVSPPCLHWG